MNHSNIRRGFHLLTIPFVLWIAIQTFPSCSNSDTSSGSNPVPPPTQSGVSFRMTVLPILSSYGCTGCHGGRAGLSAGTVSGLLQGGDHGPAVIPGKADSSILVRKISVNPPFGSRMPLSGPFMPDSTISIIKQWINEGAKDN